MKICLIRNDKMGDMILTLPIIQGLKEAYQNKIDVVCSENNSKICSNFKTINNYILLGNNIISILRTILKLRNEEYDYIYTFSPGLLGIIVSIFSKSKNKSLLILESRYGISYKSKILEKLIGKLFYDYYIIINRKTRFIQNISIHQTKVMKELIEKSGLKIHTDHKISNRFNFKKQKAHKNKICLIHISSRLINNNFSEEKFINLLTRFKASKIKLVMTTDYSSNRKFKKIYTKYKVIKSNWFEHLDDSKIVILDNMQFDDWVKMIQISSYIITPESGCVHIAGLTNNKLCIIYNAENYPEMIESEYAPFKKNYTKLLSDDKKLEEKLFLFVN